MRTDRLTFEELVANSKPVLEESFAEPLNRQYIKQVGSMAPDKCPVVTVYINDYTEPLINEFNNLITMYQRDILPQWDSIDPDDQALIRQVVDYLVLIKKSIVGGR